MAGMETSLKELGNALYTGVLISVGAVGTRYTTKNFGFKDRPLDLKVKSLAMLALDITAGSYAVKKLQDAKILPEKIFV